MKNLFYGFVAFLFLSTSSGCIFTRDYVCTCTTHDTSGLTPDDTESYPIFGSKKKNAKALCSSEGGTSGTSVTTCELE